MQNNSKLEIHSGDGCLLETPCIGSTKVMTVQRHHCLACKEEICFVFWKLHPRILPSRQLSILWKLSIRSGKYSELALEESHFVCDMHSKLCYQITTADERHSRNVLKKDLVSLEPKKRECSRIVYSSSDDDKSTPRKTYVQASQAMLKATH